MWLANHSVVTKEGSLNKGCARGSGSQQKRQSENSQSPHRFSPLELLLAFRFSPALLEQRPEVGLQVLLTEF
jgi:hypothetical protein